MKTPRTTSTYERTVAGMIILALTAAAWLPFALRSWALPFLERGLFFGSVALAVLALGLFYEAAERILGLGRGIYASVIFVSIPAVGFAANEPGMLAICGAMLMCSAAWWLASRATGDERIFMLIMLGALLIICAYFFGWFAGAFALLAPALYAVRQGRYQRAAFMAFIAAFLIGTSAQSLFDVGVPTVDMIMESGGHSSVHAVLPLFPWLLLLLPAIGFTAIRSIILSPWLQESIIITLLVTVVSALMTNSISAAAAVAPVLAMVAGETMYRRFEQRDSGLQRILNALPSLLAAGVLLVLPLLINAGVVMLSAVDPWIAGLITIVSVGLLITEVLALSRWTFAFLFASSLIFGFLLDTRGVPFTQPGEPIPQIASRDYLLMLALAFPAAVVVLLVLRRRLRPSVKADRTRVFGETRFLQFDGDDMPTPTPIDSSPAPFTFAVFGDVTGSESPVASRREGYWVFREFIRDLKRQKPRFAVSLGDLVPLATAAAYRKLRHTLAQFPIPLAAIPGNHDVVFQDRYNAAFYHDLFGPDNTAFRIGPVKFILLNNAWGSLEDSQFAWLEKELTAGDAPYVLVFCHKPLFDFRDGQSYTMEWQPHIEKLHDLFRNHHVTAVLSGHIHSLLAQEKDGVTYIISGGGGSRLVGGESAHHYLLAAVTASELSVRAMPLSIATSPTEAAPLLTLRLKPRA